jgi:hypothetical protein
MSRIIEFPITEKPITEEEVDELHAEAFRDLEGHIGDCATMAEITSQFVVNAKCTDERLAFPVFHLTEMLLNLKKHYHAAWHGGDALTKRLITSAARTAQEVKEAYGPSLAGDDNEAPAPIA